MLYFHPYFYHLYIFLTILTIFLTSPSYEVKGEAGKNPRLFPFPGCRGNGTVVGIRIQGVVYIGLTDRAGPTNPFNITV